MSPVPAQPKIYHITHVDNLAAIVREGVLVSDATMLARGGPSVTIGMSEIKKRRIIELILEQQSERLQKLEEKARFGESHAFFACKKACEETAFEIAAQYEFRCPECGEMMAPIDSIEKAKGVQDQITALKQELEALQKAV